ncbi:MAG: HAD family phosphatase [Candidatus Omnitrophica bacterium]|nr:HAD family phosphatase [Candidatus Omnitrophota bacterium]
MTPTQQTILKVKAVIFDMDGVITDTMPFHFQAWQKVLLDEGIEATHLDIYSREGQRGITSVEEIFTSYEVPFTEEKAREILFKKEELFKQIVKTQFIPGSLDFLKDLTRRGITLALVTGTARHEVLEILPEDVVKLFKVIVTGTDIQNGKPDPEPYLLALDKLKIQPEDAVVIENAPFGIKSAKTAGLKCIAIATSLPEKYLCEANQVFSSIKDMREQHRFTEMGY